MHYLNMFFSSLFLDKIYLVHHFYVLYLKTLIYTKQYSQWSESRKGWGLLDAHSVWAKAPVWGMIDDLFFLSLPMMK